MSNVLKARELLNWDGFPKICAPVVENTQDGIISMAEAVYKSEADIMEWRVDHYSDFHNIEAVNKTLSRIRPVLKDKPLLFTFRTSHEGGAADISYNEYASLLSTAGVNADLVDVEVYRQGDIKGLIRTLKKHAVVIGSYHDFNGTPSVEEITDRIIYIKETGACIPKIAVMPKNKMDVTKLIEATLLAKERLGGGPVITMSMSGMGVISRVAAEFTGSVLTFGCIGIPSAPGQIEVEKLKELMEGLHYTEERENGHGQA
ncbi:MAG: type I 3-dehydroquinate dehydratase [Lachnospiraceae bacterium]|nr:type I 3-dehydroquinate dehydratase [Lachnospiraceae bacterium]